MSTPTPASGARDRGELFERCYDQLRRIAAAQRSKSAHPPTLQPTAIVHEAWLRLCGDDAPSFADTGHFVATVAQAMRWVLVDVARRRSAAKRGGGVRRVQLDPGLLVSEEEAVDLADLDASLRRLEANDPRKATVVMLRYFGGLSLEETALALGVSVGTIKREWNFARAWLLCDIDREGRSPSSPSTPEVP